MGVIYWHTKTSGGGKNQYIVCLAKSIWLSLKSLSFSQSLKTVTFITYMYFSYIKIYLQFFLYQYACLSHAVPHWVLQSYRRHRTLRTILYTEPRPQPEASQSQHQHRSLARRKRFSACKDRHHQGKVKFNKSYLNLEGETETKVFTTEWEGGQTTPF